MLLMFPGQGSQYVGMGKDFYSKYPVARRIFNEVDEVLGFALSKILFDGPDEVLGETYNTQPAIMAFSYSIFEVLLNKLGRSVVFDNIRCVAGHSLGEYTALCVAGVFSHIQSVKLLQKRGRCMSDAYPDKGAMFACIGVKDFGVFEDHVKSIPGCFIANDNGAGQVVLSVEKDSIKLLEILEANYRLIRLNVSVPSHSPLMHSASKVMSEALEDMQLGKLTLPFISNVSADIVHDNEQLKCLLVEQIVSRVRWREIIASCVSKGVKYYLEIGSDVLGKLVKRMDRGASVYSIKTVDDFESFIGNDSVVSSFFPLVGSSGNSV